MMTRIPMVPLTDLKHFKPVTEYLVPSQSHQPIDTFTPHDWRHQDKADHLEHFW